MTDNTQSKALRMALDLEALDLDDIAAELRRLHAENTTLQVGYAAARLEIASLRAWIKTIAEEHADEMVVAHLDGRMRGRSTEPAGEYPALPGRTTYELMESQRESAIAAYRAAHGHDPDFGFAPDRAWIEGAAYVDADRVMRAAQLATDDDRAAFKAYLEDCDECAIVPDIAGAFHAGWASRVRAAQPAGAQQPGATTWMPLPGTLPEPGKPVLPDIGKKTPIRAMGAAKHTVTVTKDVQP